MSEGNARERMRTRGGCLWRLLLLGLLAGTILFLVADHFFNLRSNLTALAFRGASQPLEIRLAPGRWKPLSGVTIAELDRALERRADDGGATWRVLHIRRKARGLAQRLVQAVFDAQVNVIEFAPDRFEFMTTFRRRFAGTTALERLQTDSLTFAITANFRDPKGQPLGLVVHEGRQVNPSFPAWTGYFFVKDGRPWFGPRSLFEETPGLLMEAAQGYPSLMKSHTVFPYVDLAPNRHFDGDKITYRALGGTRQNGTVVFILSANGGVLNVAEVAALALKLNVQHATLLEGGRALQYALRIGAREWRFAAFNTVLDLPWPRLARQLSPVFIGVRPHPAPDGSISR